ncbi:lipoprotein [Streptomyces azureus]|uniref:Lipoprotein n=1 Tax=Streptomyces azureus TaxID=146537 RepID=A0A0K8PIR5_STRAJ|nr:lipoprotein [Streptomyces azureus]
MDAQFSLDGERLAFTPDPVSGETDCPVLYAAPHPVVLDTLKSADDRPHLWETLPTAL